MINAKLAMLTITIACAFAGSANAMTREEYKVQKDRVSADHKAHRDRCSALSANAKDICMAEAKGAEKVAKAELEAKYKPSTKNTREVATARANMMYDVAKEKCDDLAGNPKDVCVKDAKAAQVKAKEDAKVMKVSSDASATRSDKVGEARKEATSEKREADYKAARVRCDSLAGNAKDSCQNDAKAKFGMK